MRRNGSHLTRPAVRMLADAAVYGNCFQWHVDADPAGLATARVPPWLARHGAYANGTAGKPLFVSLLVYLDELWRQEWDAETIFLEPAIGAGFLVQPRHGRAVLMHQDGAPYAPEARLLRRAFARKPVIRIAPWLSGSATPRRTVLHRVSTPSLLARRPRYSLVWKLIFLPNHGEASGRETISRPEWGEPIQLTSK